MIPMPSWLAHLPHASVVARQGGELEMVDRSPELVPITRLLDEARMQVEEEARAKSLRIVVVPADDHVVVSRKHVVFVVAMLLEKAISMTPSGGRIALTAQEFDHELVFAVYDSGTRGTPSNRFNYVAMEAAFALGGRVWSALAPEGNLAFFSLPLAIDHN